MLPHPSDLSNPGVPDVDVVHPGVTNRAVIAFRPGLAMRTTHEQVGFELGRDYAQHALELPAPYGQEPSVLREGWLAGRSLFAARALVATRHARKWLHLRLHAWLRGRAFERAQVTPGYLQQIEASHCPVTRAPLSSATFTATDGSIDRVRNDAGYAAGNLAVLSARANQAKGANGYREALRIVARIDAGDMDGFAGLDGVAWSRIAVLCSYVEPLAHAEAAALPMTVLPPNRLRLFNPVQALQAFVSHQLLEPGWARRLRGFEELLPGRSLQRDFRRFFMALLPRVLEAGRLTSGQATRWAIEDAWGAPLVLQRWVDFADQLTAVQCEALLLRADAHRLATRGMVATSEVAAVDGWHLATRGYVPHGRAGSEVPDAGTQARAQRELAW